MAKSIRDGKSINFNVIAPRLNAPTQTEAVARETKMAQNKILYSAKLDENMRRSAYFETNKRTVKSESKVLCYEARNNRKFDAFQFLRQAEVLQDLYGVAWFQNLAVKTKAIAAIASTNTAAQNKFKDDIFEAVLQLRLNENSSSDAGSSDELLQRIG
ncbi:unnamed protein product [Cylindrotheca closterium]|nr:unnamed protein product [Cylindrotheca closterium]